MDSDQDERERDEIEAQLNEIVAGRGIGGDGQGPSTEEFVSEMKTGQSNILVAVRTRDLLQNEVQNGGKSIVRCLNENVVILMDPGTTASDDYLRLNKSREKRYAFDFVFDESATQTQVYENTCRFLLDGVLQGFNATVFCYGATSAGKTYTMIGTSECPGVMILTLQELFERVEAAKQADPGQNINVKCSMIEVYNETIKDLLAPPLTGAFGAPEIREDPVKGMFISNVSEHTEIASYKSIAELLTKGNKNRSTEPTAANVTSSRSHAVLQITVERQSISGLSEIEVAKLSMIDLAGSERAQNTNNRGIRLLEGANINKSLLALGNCINALAQDRTGSNFVPYRDSKLTRLLKDSLGGNCRTVMIANISPSHLNYEDSLNTLKYANRAKNIKTRPLDRNVLKVDLHVAKYTKIIDELKSLVVDLRKKLQEQKGGPTAFVAAPPTASMTPLPGASAPHMPGTSEEDGAWKEELLDNVKERVELKRSLIDVDTEIQQTITAKVQTQVSVSSWEGSKTGANGGVDFDLNETPRTIVNLRDELRRISNKLKEFENRKADLQFRISENELKLKKLQEELPVRVKNEDMRNFLQLLYRNQVLEIESLELAEQANTMSLAQKEVLAQKQLEIEKLNMQIQLRDKIILEIKALLPEDQLDLFNNKINKHVSYIPLSAGVHNAVFLPPVPGGLFRPAPVATLPANGGTRPLARNLVGAVESFENTKPAVLQPNGIFPSFSAYRKAAGDKTKFSRAAQLRAKSEVRLRNLKL